MSLRNVNRSACNRTASTFYENQTVINPLDKNAFHDLMYSTYEPTYKTKEQVNGKTLLRTVKGLWEHRDWNAEKVLTRWPEIQEILDQILAFCTVHDFCLRHSVSPLHTSEGVVRCSTLSAEQLVPYTALPLCAPHKWDAKKVVSSLIKLFGSFLTIKVLEAELSYYTEGRSEKLPRLVLGSALQRSSSKVQVASGQLDHLAFYLYPVLNHPILSVEGLPNLCYSSCATYLSLIPTCSYYECDERAAVAVGALHRLHGIGPKIMKIILEEIRNVADVIGVTEASETLEKLVTLLRDKSVVILKSGILCSSVCDGPFSNDYMNKWSVNPLYAIAHHGAVMKSDERVVVEMGSHFFEKIVVFHPDVDCHIEFHERVEPFFPKISCSLCEEDVKCFLCE